MSKNIVCFVLCWAGFLAWPGSLCAQAVTDFCPRPLARSAVAEPEDLRSQKGVLKVDLTAHNEKEKDGSIRYCFVDENGQESPTLRANPGDLVILTLKNDLKDFGPGSQAVVHHRMNADAKEVNLCTSELMARDSTNHGER